MERLMIKNRWLANDSLGQLGERTLWHDLKDAFNLNFEPVAYEGLADFIEAKKPSLVIRNSTYFRPLNVSCPVISLVQDIQNFEVERVQKEVIAKSSAVVFNSLYTKEKIGCPESVKSAIIPLGVDSQFWSPYRPTVTLEQKARAEKTVLWVGSSHHVKGFQLFQKIVEESDLFFKMVAKDDTHFRHPRVESFGRVSQDTLKQLTAYSSCLLCTSETETQHLSGIEAAFCGLPIVTTPVGIYHELFRRESEWGKIVPSRDSKDFISALNIVLKNRAQYTPRKAFLEYGLDKSTCLSRWTQLIKDVEGEEHE